MKNLFKTGLLIISLMSFHIADAQTEVAFYTTMGNFTAVLTDTLTPITADSFISLISKKFYDRLLFHRVIDNFMIQGGDPNGNGTGGPGFSIPDEFHPSLQNLPQTLAMANRGPNTGGSQFFINLVPNLYLNNRHTVFGTVTSNFSVVQAIAKVPKNGMDKPVTDVVMDSVRITNYPAAASAIKKEIPVNVYPNPCRGAFSIDLPGKATSVEVVTMGGQVVYQTKGKGTIKVDMKAQPKGLYKVRTANSKGEAEYKLIIQ